MFGCDGRASASIRNARSRISGEYFLFIVFHPCLKNGTKVRPIHAVQEGKSKVGNQKGTTLFSLNGVYVVVNNKTGAIITTYTASGGGM